VEKDAEAFSVDWLDPLVIEALAESGFSDGDQESADELEACQLEVQSAELWILDVLEDEEDGLPLLRVAPRDGRVRGNALAADQEFLVRRIARVGQLVVVIAGVGVVDSAERLKLALGDHGEWAVAEDFAARTVVPRGVEGVQASGILAVAGADQLRVPPP